MQRGCTNGINAYDLINRDNGLLNINGYSIYLIYYNII